MKQYKNITDVKNAVKDLDRKSCKKYIQESRKELIEDEIKFLKSFQYGIDRKYLDIENRIKELENKTK